jgi:hypothetical protein
MGMNNEARKVGEPVRGLGVLSANYSRRPQFSVAPT